MQTKSCNWFTANPDAFARRSAGGLHVRDRLPHVRAALPVATTSAPGLSDPSDGDPLITVLLPHYGCESYLSMAVASILRQTLTRFVLYIIDDCSPTDDWLTAVRPHLGDSRVKLFRTTKNVGPYRIANGLVPSITSPFVAFQDADDRSHPRRLQTELELMLASRADIVGCSFVCLNPSGDVVRTWRMPRWSNFWHAVGKNFLAHHPTVLARRGVFDALNGFDGTTRFGADSDFMTRAAYLFRIRNAREVLYSYLQRTGSLTLNPETGFGSPARKAYRRQLALRRCEWDRLEGSPSLPEALRARDNDVDFEIHPVPAACVV